MNFVKLSSKLVFFDVYYSSRDRTAGQIFAIKFDGSTTISFSF